MFQSKLSEFEPCNVPFVLTYQNAKALAVQKIMLQRCTYCSFHVIKRIFLENRYFLQ